MKQTIQVFEDGKLVKQLHYDAKNDPLIDYIFKLCVIFLLWLAAKFRMTYNAINVWIFCVLLPILIIGLIIALILKW